jgi:predicted house-cleaning noncanonical NTP pyrophosphatase (MazG superfamily)
MSKLVRDGVEAHIRAAGGAHVTFSGAHPDRRLPLLFSKLLEEAGEWLGAEGREERLKELGDLVEVIWALGEIEGIEGDEILMQAFGKRRERGRFERLMVMSVELGPAHEVAEAISRSTTGRGLGDGPWYSG